MFFAYVHFIHILELITLDFNANHIEYFVFFVKFIIRDFQKTSNLSQIFPKFF